MTAEKRSRVPFQIMPVKLTTAWTVRIETLFVRKYYFFLLSSPRVVFYSLALVGCDMPRLMKRCSLHAFLRISVIPKNVPIYSHMAFQDPSSLRSFFDADILQFYLSVFQSFRPHAVVCLIFLLISLFRIQQDLAYSLISGF